MRSGGSSGTSEHVPFALPEPPLVDARAGVALRPWRAVDAAALVAAWGVADIAGQSTVPGAGSEADAARWISGAAARRAMGLSLDLVVGPVDGDEVWGEVGLAALALTGGGRTHREVEVGWWLHPQYRGRGLAAAAAGLLVGWALTTGGRPRVVARIDRGATGSEAVATAVGLRRLAALDAGRDLWTGGGAERPGPSV